MDNVKKNTSDSVGNAIFVDGGPLKRNYDSYLTKMSWRICIQIKNFYTCKGAIYENIVGDMLVNSG